MNSVLKVTDKTYLNAVELLKKHIHSTKLEGNVFIVGGFVRDAILSRKPNDINLVVSMPDGGRQLSNFLWKEGFTEEEPVMSKENGSYEFHLKGATDISIKATQTRRSKFTKGMLTEVGIFGTIESDALLRDITINAIYYNVSTEKIKDPTGKGMLDIFQHRIRTVGDPSDTFQADPLRLVRIIRQSTELIWNIEKKTWFSIVKNACLAKTIDLFDFNVELAHILCQNHPSLAIYKLYYSGLLEYLLPDMDGMMLINDTRTPEKTLLAHTLDVVDKVSASDILARYAAFFHDYGKLIPSIFFNSKVNPIDTTMEFLPSLLEELGINDTIADRILDIIKYHDFFDKCAPNEIPSTKQVRKFMGLFKKEDMYSCLQLILANNTSITIRRKPLQVKQILDKIDEIEKSDKEHNRSVILPITGKDIMSEYNLQSGSAVGMILNAVRDAYSENNSMTKEQCLQYAGEYIKKLTI